MNRSDAVPDAADESLVYEIDLSAPVEKVWHALTTPELLAQWLLPEPQEPLVEVDVQLASSRPPHYIAYHWYGEDEPASLVIFELRATPDGGTHLRLTHRIAESLCGPVALRMAA